MRCFHSGDVVVSAFGFLQSEFVRTAVRCLHRLVSANLSHSKALNIRQLINWFELISSNFLLDFQAGCILEFPFESINSNELSNLSAD